MKKLLFILLLVLPFIGISQINSTNTNNYVTEYSVEKLIDKYSDKLEASLISLSKELKQPVEYVYKLVVRQQYVEGISSILLLIISIIVLFIGCSRIGLKTDFEEEFPWIIPIVVGGFLLIGAVIWIFDSGITCLVNPEYAAIKDIISFFN